MIKRTLDVIASTAGLLVLSTLLAAIALMVRVKPVPPILFKQARPKVKRLL